MAKSLSSESARAFAEAAKRSVETCDAGRAERTPTGAGGAAPSYHFYGECSLNRYLLIFRDRIFDSKVEAGMPSLAAAPDNPDTLPLV